MNLWYIICNNCTPYGYLPVHLRFQVAFLTVGSFIEHTRHPGNLSVKLGVQRSLETRTEYDRPLINGPLPKTRLLKPLNDQGSKRSAFPSQHFQCGDCAAIALTSAIAGHVLSIRTCIS